MGGVLLGKLLTVFQIWPSYYVLATFSIAVIFNAGRKFYTRDLLNNCYILRRHLKISHFHIPNFDQR